ncbi:formate hydrogenlyase [Roseomonas sp. BN140053]|uniref:formate hydrogenlyase n=1 Tax=Roseomonas sp. BN140053 TaxID=3391898 RepID=UPI0039EB402E
MTALSGLATQALHLLLVLLAAPVVLGLPAWLAARLEGRRGAAPWQPWRDLLKHLALPPLLPEHASPLFRVAPYLAAGATLAAAVLVPSFARGMLLAPLADLPLLFGLLALARAALLLAALDSGTATGGLAVGRALPAAAFGAPALLVATLVLAVLGGGTNLDLLAASLAEGTEGRPLPLLLAAGALAALGLAATDQLPAFAAGEGSGRRALLAEASGRHLAVWEFQEGLLLLVWLDLLITLFLPFGTAPAGAGPLAWAVGLLGWAGKLALLCLALATARTLLAAPAPRRVPAFLGGALLLALLGAVLLSVGTAIG